MTPHHWINGPQDVEPLNQARTRWQFRWWLEPSAHVDIIGEDDIAYWVDVLLNKIERSWGARTGVQFVQVRQELAHITFRFSNDIPPGATGWAAGWNYQEAGHNIAQISPNGSVLGNPYLFAHLLGMELVGHGCFRMHDMYTEPHGGALYRGAMGLWHPALADVMAFPSDDEITSAKLWLQGKAEFVHLEAP